MKIECTYLTIHNLTVFNHFFLILPVLVIEKTIKKSPKLPF